MILFTLLLFVGLIVTAILFSVGMVFIIPILDLVIFILLLKLIFGRKKRKMKKLKK